MAMSEEAMEDLLQLYRQSAREAPAAQVDARILHAAIAQSKRQRSRSLLWPLAAAASVLLWASLHGISHEMQGAAGELVPGYGAGRIRAQLLQMDVKPPSSEVARYLMGNALVPHNDHKEISP
jgi:hypothetical protein